MRSDTSAGIPKITTIAAAAAMPRRFKPGAAVNGRMRFFRAGMRSDYIAGTEGRNLWRPSVSLSWPSRRRRGSVQSRRNAVIRLGLGLDFIAADARRNLHQGHSASALLVEGKDAEVGD